MSISTAGNGSGVKDALWLGRDEPLLHCSMFCAADLDATREYLSGTIAPHSLTFSTHDRALDFRHYGARLDSLLLNDLRYGGEVTVATKSDVVECYLLQFMLGGACRGPRAGAPTT